MDKALFVGAGGFIGSVMRYWVSGVVQQNANNPSFPFGTLTTVEKVQVRVYRGGETGA
jgi:fluoride ion exporter CrcB/FEX